MKKIERLFYQISQQRGRINERHVLKVLESLKQKSKIVSFYKTNRREDKQHGIDFVLFTLDGQRIELQVKSSKFGAKKHQQKFPHIPVIVIDSRESQETIEDKILKIIKNQSADLNLDT